MEMPEPHPAPQVMTLTQTAQLLRLSEERVKAEVYAGRLAGRRIGRSWRFSRAAVLAWLHTMEDGGAR